MTPASTNINSAWASLLMHLLARIGISHVVISPGSRSTPLTVAAARQNGLHTTVHFDERGAGFFALGLARATGHPVALICTSGSAVANYLPAVVEASMDNLPLLLLTADRPPDLHDRGANQTIPQAGLFGSFTRSALDLPCPDGGKDFAATLESIAEACEVFASRAPGPVQVNCPFREPLAPDADGKDHAKHFEAGESWLNTFALDKNPRTADVTGEQFAAQVTKPLSKASTVVLVAGKIDSNKSREAVLKLARHTGWPLLPDIQSGLRIGSRSCPTLVSHIDQLLISEQARTELQPDCVLHLGGRVISKRLLEWLKECQPATYVRVDDCDMPFDPNDQVTTFAATEISGFVSHLVDSLPEKRPRDVSLWQRAEDMVAGVLAEEDDSSSLLTEPMVCRYVSRHLASDEFDGPNRPLLWAASSLPIRMLDMYAPVDGAPLTLGANRGASGIDGTIASAAGFAAGHQRPLVLLIGDLAFLHDLNSLAIVKQSAVPITISVLNNNGGNIFSLLPIAKHRDVFQDYFITPHDLSFGATAEQFGLSYDMCRSMGAFKTAFENHVHNEQSSIIELAIDREAGPAQMRKIATSIRERLDD